MTDARSECRRSGEEPAFINPLVIIIRLFGQLRQMRREISQGGDHYLLNFSFNYPDRFSPGFEVISSLESDKA